MPQGTNVGPWLFILMINDLHPSGSDVWKYVDDTTLAEVVPRGGQSGMQVAVNAVEQWSTINKLQLNADKCKELVIDFKKVKHHFHAVTVNSQELERVDSIKLLRSWTKSVKNFTLCYARGTHPVNLASW